MTITRDQVFKCFQFEAFIAQASPSVPFSFPCCNPRIIELLLLLHFFPLFHCRVTAVIASVPEKRNQWVDMSCFVTCCYLILKYDGWAFVVPEVLMTGRGIYCILE